MKGINKYVVLIAVITSLSGCGLMYRIILGADVTPQWFEQKDIEKEFTHYEIPGNQSYILDTASFTQALNQKYKQDTLLLKLEGVAYDSLKLQKINSCSKDDGQVVSIRFFDSKGEPIFKLVNCDLDPPIPMSWNIDSCFNFFPPRPLSWKKGQIDLKLRFILPHIKTLSGDSVTFQNLPKTDYYAIVMWNNFLIKPSRKLIKELRSYLAEYSSSSVTVLYVNNHNQVMWRMMSKEDREMVKKELSQQKH